MKILLMMIIILLVFISPGIAKTDSQFWGNWVANSNNKSIEITVTENEVFLFLNGKKVENITYEFYSAISAKRINLQSLFIHWKGGNYGDFYLTLKPVNSNTDTLMTPDLLIGVYQAFQIIDDIKEIESEECIPVRFANKKNNKVSPIYWNQFKDLKSD